MVGLAHAFASLCSTNMLLLLLPVVVQAQVQVQVLGNPLIAVGARDREMREGRDKP